MPEEISAFITGLFVTGAASLGLGLAAGAIKKVLSQL